MINMGAKRTRISAGAREVGVDATKVRRTRKALEPEQRAGDSNQG
jgi:hypothetical protein